MAEGSRVGTNERREISGADFPPPSEPDWQALTSDNEFGEAAFELLKEVVLTGVLLVHRIPPMPYQRDEAIRRGLIKRLILSGKSLLADISHNHGYQQTQIVRQIIEAAANYHYLADDDGSGDRYDAYINHSLAEEKHNLRVIATEVRARGGDPLPIEERMRASIDRMATAAGTTFDAVPSKKESSWPNVFERLKALSPVAYMAYRGGSSALHSGWTILLMGDIREVEGGFSLDAARPPGVQSMTAAGIVLSETTLHYLGRDGDALERAWFVDRLKDVVGRIRRLDDAHEEFMQEA